MISTSSSIFLIYSYYSELIHSYFRVLSHPILSYPIPFYPLPFYPLPFYPLSFYPLLFYPHLSCSYLIFPHIQTRAISCYTSTAFKKIRNARAGEWRIEEKDSGMMKEVMCSLFFQNFFVEDLMQYSAEFRAIIIVPF